MGGGTHHVAQLNGGSRLSPNPVVRSPVGQPAGSSPWTSDERRFSGRPRGKTSVRHRLESRTATQRRARRSTRPAATRSPGVAPRTRSPIGCRTCAVQEWGLGRHIPARRGLSNLPLRHSGRRRVRSTRDDCRRASRRGGGRVLRVGTTMTPDFGGSANEPNPSSEARLRPSGVLRLMKTLLCLPTLSSAPR